MQARRSQVRGCLLHFPINRTRLFNQFSSALLIKKNDSPFLQGGQPESFSHIEMPSIDTALWEKMLSLGLDPVEVLLGSGLTRDKVQLVLQASGLAAYCEQVQGSSSSSSRSSNDGSVDGSGWPLYTPEPADE